MFKEFKEFAMQGSLVATAIAFVMGAAFGKLTGAFIDGIVMPLVSVIVQTDFSAWQTELAPAAKAADGTVIPAIIMKYGDFIAGIINFLVVALVMFLIVKALKKAKIGSALAAPPQEVLLAEIRDLLKK